MFRNVGPAVSALAVVVIVAGCSARTTSAGTATPRSTPSSTIAGAPMSAADSARQQALAVYQTMWRDFVVAGTTSDWQSSALSRSATGIALSNLSRGLYADHYNGLVTKGDPVLNPSVSSVDPAADPKKIVVSDCGDSTHWLKYRASDGQLADDKPGGRQSINAIVEKQSDGSWKVSDFGVHGVGTC